MLYQPAWQNQAVIRKWSKPQFHNDFPTFIPSARLNLVPWEILLKNLQNKISVNQVNIGSLAQVMICCLPAPNHSLNQYWPVKLGILPRKVSYENSLDKTCGNVDFKSIPGVNELKSYIYKDQLLIVERIKTSFMNPFFIISPVLLIIANLWLNHKMKCH